MKFRKAQDFTMYHDITDGESAGWVVSFTLHYGVKGQSVCHVTATSPTGRIMRSPRDVAKIFPMEDWPPYALESLTQKSDSPINERLFY